MLASSHVRLLNYASIVFSLPQYILAKTWVWAYPSLYMSDGGKDPRAYFFANIHLLNLIGLYLFGLPTLVGGLSLLGIEFLAFNLPIAFKRRFNHFIQTVVSIPFRVASHIFLAFAFVRHVYSDIRKAHSTQYRITSIFQSYLFFRDLQHLIQLSASGNLTPPWVKSMSDLDASLLIKVINFKVFSYKKDLEARPSLLKDNIYQLSLAESLCIQHNSSSSGFFAEIFHLLSKKAAHNIKFWKSFENVQVCSIIFSIKNTELLQSFLTLDSHYVLARLAQENISLNQCITVWEAGAELIIEKIKSTPFGKQALERARQNALKEKTLDQLRKLCTTEESIIALFKTTPLVQYALSENNKYFLDIFFNFYKKDPQLWLSEPKKSQDLDPIHYCVITPAASHFLNRFIEPLTALQAATLFTQRPYNHFFEPQSLLIVSKIYNTSAYNIIKRVKPYFAFSILESTWRAQERYADVEQFQARKEAERKQKEQESPRPRTQYKGPAPDIFEKLFRDFFFNFLPNFNNFTQHSYQQQNGITNKDILDACKVLGISVAATAEEADKAYKKLALTWHPDRWSKKSQKEQDAAADKFKTISTSHDLLKQNPNEWELARKKVAGHMPPPRQKY